MHVKRVDSATTTGGGQPPAGVTERSIIYRSRISGSAGDAYPEIFYAQGPTPPMRSAR